MKLTVHKRIGAAFGQSITQEWMGCGASAGKEHLAIWRRRIEYQWGAEPDTRFTLVTVMTTEAQDEGEAI